MTADARHRHPWTKAEEAYVRCAISVEPKVPHKTIARHLNRTPRSVDQHVAQMKQKGRLAMHRREELELLAKLEAEALLPSDLA